MTATRLSRRIVRLISVGVVAIGLALPAGAESGGGSAPVRVAAPSNDNFHDALPLGIGDFGGLTNVGATVQSGEPELVQPYLLGATVWFKFTARRAGQMRITTRGTDAAFNHVLAVWRGPRVRRLRLVAVDSTLHASGPRFSRVLFHVRRGVTYRVDVGGYPDCCQADEGNFTLHRHRVT